MLYIQCAECPWYAYEWVSNVWFYQTLLQIWIYAKWARNFSIASEYQNVTSNQPKKYPHYADFKRRKSKLIIVLKQMKASLDYLCSGGAQGFIASVHSPSDRPQMFKRYFYIPPKQTLLVAVDPIVKRANGSVLTHDPHVRNCYVASERQLRFYKQYTVENCRLECLTNMTLYQCGCVKFSMPRESQLSSIYGEHIFLINQVNPQFRFQEQMARKFVDQERLNVTTISMMVMPSKFFTLICVSV